MASAFREATESQLDDSQRLLRLQVEQAYSEVLLAMADLESARSLLPDYGRILAVQRARFNKGSISGSDRIRAEGEAVLRSEFGIRHCTLQMEGAGCASQDTEI